MKSFLLLSASLLLFAGCKKEEKTHTVIYKVIVIGGHPTYSVQFSSSKNNTVSQGPFSSGTWISEKITDKEGGSTASLTLSGGTGGSYNMYIYIDGTLQQDGRMDDPYGPRTISVEVPEE